MKCDWIPVTSGLFPSEKKEVQVTYLGFYDKKPYCDAFAFYKGSKWYWCEDATEVKVEITAWKYNCEPYKGN